MYFITFCNCNFCVLDIKIRKNTNIRHQRNEVPHLPQDTTWKSDNSRRKHHTQWCQEASPFKAGEHKAAKNRQESMTETNHK